MTIEGTPFATVDEAWFWYCAGQRARDDGAHQQGRGLIRPCDIDCIAIVFHDLRKRGKFSKKHLEVMAEYGALAVAPDPHSSSVQRHDRVFWDQAMDRLYTPLAQKGIVELRSGLTKRKLSNKLATPAGLSAS